MNEQKWSTTGSIGRLVDHLAAVLPGPLLALVACELAEHARPELAGSGSDHPLQSALDRVRAWAAAEGPAPQWSEVHRLSNEEPWPNEGELAATLLAVALQPRAVRELAAHVACALADPSASEVLADALRAIVPFIAVPQMRFERVRDDRFRTEELDCELSQGRLVRCVRRSRG